MENLVDFYLKQLKDTNNAGKVLYTFYVSLFNAKPNMSVLKQFHRMNKVYGRYRVFFALIDIHDSHVSRGKQFITENPYPLIVHVIKSSVRSEYAGEMESNKRSLDGYIEEFKKHIEQKKIFDIPDSFEGDECQDKNN